MTMAVLEKGRVKRLHKVSASRQVREKERERKREREKHMYS